MPAPRKGARLGSGPAHEKQLLANLAAHLFESEAGAITTTLAKAKALRPYAERLITQAKKGGVHQHRLVVARMHDKKAAHILFDEIAPRYSDRNGGYLRILKLGPRPGDRAPMARVELV
jgi:large subunit ribosomal protein L17